ncbi:hypothetical protein MBLNU230_g1196t1 [Neophaeotheca triangularis]
MLSFNTLLAAVLALLHVSTAHLIMDYPVPMGLDSLDNSPLADAKPGTPESDFPCKQRPGVYDLSIMNNFKVDDPIKLNFTGSASHGGGTCQIAVSMDKQPDYQSTWKIIQVFEGGCPVSSAGNDGTDEFSFKIPNGFPNGEATLSWTWYNRVGNREFYMNCAAITVTGGADDGQAYYNSLPDLYVVNLPTTECKSVESNCQKIPHPGQFVLRANDDGEIAAATGPSCAASAAAQTEGVQGYKTAPSDESAATQAPGVGRHNDNAPTSQVPDGAYVTSAPATTSVVQTSAPTTYPTLSPSDGQGVSSPGSENPTAAPTAPESSKPDPTPLPKHDKDNTNDSCTTDGAIVCNGSSQFGLCNHGKVVWQDVAPGTECNGGVVQKVKRAEPGNSAAGAEAQAHEKGMRMMHEKMEQAHEEGMTMGAKGMHEHMRGHGQAHRHARKHVGTGKGGLDRAAWRELSVEEAVGGV